MIYHILSALSGLHPQLQRLWMMMLGVPPPAWFLATPPAPGTVHHVNTYGTRPKQMQKVITNMSKTKTTWAWFEHAPPKRFDT